LLADVPVADLDSVCATMFLVAGAQLDFTQWGERV
jgi:hypothetical protein